MDNKSLLVLSFIIFLIGITILVILYFNLPVKLIKISKINNDVLNLRVKVIGEVVKISNYKAGFKLLNIKDESGDIDIFVDNEKSVRLGKFDKIIVIGKVSEYKNNLQINAEKINRLNLG